MAHLCEPYLDPELCLDAMGGSRPVGGFRPRETRIHGQLGALFRREMVYMSADGQLGALNWLAPQHVIGTPGQREQISQPLFLL